MSEGEHDSYRLLKCIEIRFSRLKPAPSMFAFYLL